MRFSEIVKKYEDDYENEQLVQLNLKQIIKYFKEQGR